MQEVYIDEISYTLVYDTPTLQRKKFECKWELFEIKTWHWLYNKSVYKHLSSKET